MNTERALDVADVHPDPMVQFRRWFVDAEAAEVPEPEAMCLTTVSADAVPSARMVLLKGIDDQGFLFFTNYQSQKAREAAANPAVALVWRWHALERQVRAVGLAQRAGPGESESLLRHPAVGSTDRRLGVAPESGAGRPRRADRVGGGGGEALR